MKRKKILLVDDSPTILMMERLVLKKSPYDVVTASNGHEGVVRALREMPDLILMDVVMPQMSGFEACRRLRQEESTRNIPVIMVTTRGEAENIEKGFESGCTDYITKPIDVVELLAKLKNHIGE
jgi:DNA-binding response OmpR family regulator